MGLSGDEGEDVLFGGGGNDYLNGGADDDTLYGDDKYSTSPTGIPGNDTLVGGAGNDHLEGEQGNDVLRGGSGIDLMWGGNEADVFDFDRPASTSRFRRTPARRRSRLPGWSGGDRWCATPPWSLGRCVAAPSPRPGAAGSTRLWSFVILRRGRRPFQVPARLRSPCGQPTSRKADPPFVPAMYVPAWPEGKLWMCEVR